MDTNSAKTMTLEQAIEWVENRCYANENTSAAWEVVKAHLAPREVSDEDVERILNVNVLNQCTLRQLLGPDATTRNVIVRAILQADRQRGGGNALYVICSEYRLLGIREALEAYAALLGSEPVAWQFRNVTDEGPSPFWHDIDREKYAVMKTDKYAEVRALIPHPAKEATK